MAQLASNYPIRRLCAALEVSESGYYAWRKLQPSQRREDEQQLAKQIEQVYQASRRTYGSPRVQAELRAAGVRCSRKRIARLMRQRGLSARRKVQRAHTTDSQHAHPVASNRLNREFTAQQPNEKWVADITGVWTSQGWLYVAAVLDLFSRKVIGWAMAARREDDLVLAALRMALQARRPPAGRLASFRSREPVHESRLSGAPTSLGDRGQHESQGRLLRQCPDGKLLCHLEGRMHRSAPVGEPRPGTTSDL